MRAQDGGTEDPSPPVRGDLHDAPGDAVDDGPVEVAVDYMVFNVTKDDIRVRMAAIDEDIWPLPSVTEKLPADPSQRVGFSDEIMSGRVVFEDVIKWYYESTHEKFGPDYKPPVK